MKPAVNQNFCLRRTFKLIKITKANKLAIKFLEIKIVFTTSNNNYYPNFTYICLDVYRLFNEKDLIFHETFSTQSKKKI